MLELNSEAKSLSEKQKTKNKTGNVAEKKGAAVGDEDWSRDGRVLVAGAGPEERSS